MFMYASLFRQDTLLFNPQFIKNIGKELPATSVCAFDQLHICRNGATSLVYIDENIGVLANFIGDLIAMPPECCIIAKMLLHANTTIDGMPYSAYQQAIIKYISICADHNLWINKLLIQQSIA